MARIEGRLKSSKRMTDYAKWDKMAAMLADDSDDDDEVVSSPRRVRTARLGRLGVCAPFLGNSPVAGSISRAGAGRRGRAACALSAAHMTRGAMS